MLADRLSQYRQRKGVLVLAIPRSGVPVAAAIASKLDLPLAMFPCRKLVHPSNPQLTIGSVCHDEVVLHPDREIPTDLVSHQVHRLRREIIPEQKAYGIPDQTYEGKTVILVDDRLKQSDTLAACLRSLKKKSPSRILVAVPVATAGQVRKLEQDGVQVVTLRELNVLTDTATYYEHFDPPSDREIQKIWERLGHPSSPGKGGE